VGNDLTNVKASHRRASDGSITGGCGLRHLLDDTNVRGHRGGDMKIILALVAASGFSLAIASQVSADADRRCRDHRYGAAGRARHQRRSKEEKRANCCEAAVRSRSDTQQPHRQLPTADVRGKVVNPGAGCSRMQCRRGTRGLGNKVAPTPGKCGVGAVARSVTRREAWADPGRIVNRDVRCGK
jgi:hypothetical protein